MVSATVSRPPLLICSAAGVPLLPDHASFRIDTAPCIPVRTGRRYELLGLREVMLRAHEIEDLALAIPPAASSLLRVLTAITARVTDLDDPELNAEEWTDSRNALLQAQGGFNPERVHSYFDRYVWDLFHPTRPFLQDPALALQCEERAGVNKLVFGRPAGNALAWLSAHSDTEPYPVPCDEALWHLLAQHSYAAAGGCSKRTVDGACSAKAKAGPLRSTISFHPLGRTLLETLLAGLPKFGGDWQDTPDTCPWEEPAPPAPTRPPAAMTWPGRLLTGRSRHAVLLVPTPDGRAVADAFMTWGTQHPPLEATDPYLVYHLNPERPVARRRSPRPADADRAIWRDLDALLLAGDETATVQRPTAFATLNDLPPDVRAALRVRVHGFDQDGKTINRTWYTALTPPIWPWTQEHDPAAARRIAECRAAAETTGKALATQATKAWQAAITPSNGPGARKPPKRLTAWTTAVSAAYWPRAETTFWRLLDTPDVPARPAFAADAVAVLRQVTAPAITQHRRAAPAVASAVATLLKQAHQGQAA